MTRTVLITGANRGIGLEFARQYLDSDWQVLATCRNPDAAEALSKLARAAGAGLQIFRLEVTDAGSVAALAAKLRGRPLDLLINNAGVYGPQGSRLDGLDGAAWLKVFAANSVAPIQITAALLGSLKAAPQAKVIAISSRMGSISDNTSGGAQIYRSSKAALNAAMASTAIDLRDAGISVGILHPGWVETDMGGPNALIDVKTSVMGMCKVIDELDISKSGKFFSYDGSEIGW